MAEFGNRHFLFLLPFVMAFFLLFLPYQQTSTQRHITLGAWTQGFFDSNSKTLHPERLSTFEQLVDKKVSLAHYYLGWEYLDKPELLDQFQTIRSFGWTPMLNINPYYFSECPQTKENLYKAIASGKCDAFLHKAGQNLSQIKQPFYLLFAWEMNNSNNYWSLQKTQSNPTDFIAAWQHIHNIFAEEHANNIVWVFCPNVPDDPDVPYNQIYPGDKFVDWIGLDGYNWGTTQPWSQWDSFYGIFESAYENLTTIAPNKPLILAEVNTTDQGGDKGQWYQDMLNNQIPNNFPKISAVVIFNEDRSTQEGVNWNVNSNSQSLDAFKSAVKTDIYN